MADEEILPAGRAESRVAADVVLLPDDATTNKVIEINSRLAREYSSDLVLNRTDCLPHISLAMGCVDPRDVAAIRETLEHLAKESHVEPLTATGIETSANARGQITSLLIVERTEGLQTLHERVMEEMTRFFSHDVAGVRFYDDAVSESTLDWVRNYREKAGYERFHPHVTLGYGPARASFSFPLTFRPSRLALCHLGNHATCRKVLAAADMR
ncbi:MAG: 2'-5' RNA ligase family protein [Phycisphaerales bacterium]